MGIAAVNRNNLSEYILYHDISPEASLSKNFRYNYNIINEASANHHAAFSLGFEIRINNLLYNRAIVSEYGFLILIRNTFSGTTQDIFDDLFDVDPRSTPNGYVSNKTIKTGASFQRHILICPWFSENSKSSFRQTGFSTYIFGKEYLPRMFQGNKSGVWIDFNKQSDFGESLIIRWSIIQSELLSTNYAYGNAVEFECEIYKNGRIEIRYNKLNPDETFNNFNYSSSSETSSTAGIFCLGLGFRDFSFSKVSSRDQYKFGGYIDDGVFTENSKPYANTLTLKDNWFGKDRNSCVLTFIPKLSLPRTKILGKRFNKLQNNFFKNKKYFDDRLSIVAVDNQQINYPLTRELFYGNGTEINRQQNISNFISLDTFGTGVFNFSSAGDYLFPHKNIKNSIYSDRNSGAQNNSSILTEINLELPIDYNILMLNQTSSLYAYNFKNRSFMVINADDILNPVLSPSDTLKSKEWRGFSPTGYFVVSASSIANPLYSYDLNKNNFNKLLSNNNFPDTFQFSEDYKDNNNFITLDIDENLGDLYVDEIDLKIPYAVGSLWLNDFTKYRFFSAEKPLSKTNIGHYDVGGPGITVSIFCRRQDSLELIGKKTITNLRDNFDTDKIECVNYYSASSGGAKTYFFGERFKFYFDQPDYIINSYTALSGTIDLTINSSVSNGCKFIYFKDIADPYQFLQQEYLNIDLITESSSIAFTTQLDPFARNKSGFNFSDKSIETDIAVLSKDNFISDNELKIKNPYYYNRLTSTDITKILTHGYDARFAIIGDISAKRDSRYCIKKGDQIILAISKCRTVLSTSYSGVGGIRSVVTQAVSGSHDFFLTGDKIELKVKGRHYLNQKIFDPKTVNNDNIMGVKDQFYGLEFLDTTDKRYNKNNLYKGYLSKTNFYQIKIHNNIINAQLEADHIKAYLGAYVLYYDDSNPISSGSLISSNLHSHFSNRTLKSIVPSIKSLSTNLNNSTSVINDSNQNIYNLYPTINLTSSINPIINLTSSVNLDPNISVVLSGTFLNTISQTYNKQLSSDVSTGIDIQIPGMDLSTKNFTSDVIVYLNGIRMLNNVDVEQGTDNDDLQFNMDTKSGDIIIVEVSIT